LFVSSKPDIFIAPVLDGSNLSLSASSWVINDLCAPSSDKILLSQQWLLEETGAIAVLVNSWKALMVMNA